MSYIFDSSFNQDTTISASLINRANIDASIGSESESDLPGYLPTSASTPITQNSLDDSIRKATKEGISSPSTIITGFTSEKQQSRTSSAVIEPMNLSGGSESNNTRQSVNENPQSPIIDNRNKSKFEEKFDNRAKNKRHRKKVKKAGADFLYRVLNLSGRPFSLSISASMLLFNVTATGVFGIGLLALTVTGKENDTISQYFNIALLRTQTHAIFALQEISASSLGIISGAVHFLVVASANSSIVNRSEEKLIGKSIGLMYKDLIRDPIKVSKLEENSKISKNSNKLLKFHKMNTFSLSISDKVSHYFSDKIRVKKKIDSYKCEIERLNAEKSKLDEILKTFKENKKNKTTENDTTTATSINRPVESNLSESERNGQKSLEEMTIKQLKEQIKEKKRAIERYSNKINYIEKELAKSRINVKINLEMKILDLKKTVDRSEKEIDFRERLNKYIVENKNISIEEIEKFISLENEPDSPIDYRKIILESIKDKKENGVFFVEQSLSNDLEVTKITLSKNKAKLQKLNKLLSGVSIDKINFNRISKEYDLIHFTLLAIDKNNQDAKYSIEEIRRLMKSFNVKDSKYLNYRINEFIKNKFGLTSDYIEKYKLVNALIEEEKIVKEEIRKLI